MTVPDLRPPLVLLHGALGAAAQFAALRSLLDAHFHVFTLDFEGHGARSASERGYRMAHFVENLADLIVTERLASARVFGYSMGGYAALVLAAQQPALIHSVVTLGTKFVWDEPTAAREASRLDPGVIAAKVPAFADALAARHTAGAGWEAVVNGTADVLRDLGTTPLLTPDVIARISQPVRVLVGDRDATVTIDETAAAFRTFPNGQLGVLPGTPHPLERVALAELTHQLRTFLGAHND